MDLAKYRTVFIEESTDHLAEISSALLDLEKGSTNAEAIDLIFRMAHSIKGMAASLGYDSITEIAHRLEDRMQEARSAGHLTSTAEFALLFRGFDRLEAMVAVVRETGESPPADPEFARILSEPQPAPAVAAAARAPKKKALNLRL